MIEEQVVVMSTTSQGAWVEGIQQSACGSCSAKAGCGQHAMSQLGKKVTLWLPFADSASELSDQSLSVGQQIVVGLPEGAILKSTLVLYGVPLVALVLGAIVGHALWGELGSIMIACFAMLLGFKLAAKVSANNKRSWQPQFLRNCSQTVKEFDRNAIIHSAK